MQLSSRWVRVERQESASCPALSLDRSAAGAFQSYVNGYLGFSVKRAGILYGRFLEDGTAMVDAIFEPRQQGSALSVAVEPGTREEEIADSVATMLGMQRVGWVFSQSIAEREHVLSAEEVVQMARFQQACGGGKGVTAVVSLWEEEEGKHVVHFEAFQVTRNTAEQSRESG